jgi:hypothetical protein
MTHVVLEVLGDFTGAKREERLPASSIRWVSHESATTCLVNLGPGESWRVVGHASIVATKLWGKED